MPQRENDVEYRVDYPFERSLFFKSFEFKPVNVTHSVPAWPNEPEVPHESKALRYAHGLHVVRVEGQHGEGSHVVISDQSLVVSKLAVETPRPSNRYIAGVIPFAIGSKFSNVLSLYSEDERRLIVFMSEIGTFFRKKYALWRLRPRGAKASVMEQAGFEILLRHMIPHRVERIFYDRSPHFVPGAFVRTQDSSAIIGWSSTSGDH